MTFVVNTKWRREMNLPPLIRALSLLEALTGCGLLLATPVSRISGWSDTRHLFLITIILTIIQVAIFLTILRRHFDPRSTSSWVEVILVGSTTIGFASIIAVPALFAQFTGSEAIILVAIALFLILTGSGTLVKRAWGWLVNLVFVVALTILSLWAGLSAIRELWLTLCLSLPLTLALTTIVWALVRSETRQIFFAKGRDDSPDPIDQIRNRSKGHHLASLWPIFVLHALTWIVVLPNVLNARNRTLQKRTMANISHIVWALNAYALDCGHFPDASSMDELATALVPTYTKDLPRFDGWGWPLEYQHILIPAIFPVDSRKGTELYPPDGFVVRSPGKDGIFEVQDPSYYPGGPITNFNCDLVYRTLGISQWPEGMMPP